MALKIRVHTVILSGGRIEISRPEFIPGQQATVVVLIEDQSSVEPRHVIDILANVPGHRLFQRPDEVDAYLREERDSWES